jgi:hypothetical protein
VREEEVFFRVLSAILIKKGHAAPLAARLRKLIDQYEWSVDGQMLFSQMKKNYVADAMEQATTEVYKQYMGNHEKLLVHLRIDEVRALQSSGWEIGNHTDGHRILSSQTPEKAVRSIESNARFFSESGIDLINFLCFPVGRAQDVNQTVSEWLNFHQDFHGIFANHGINMRFNRKEWLRFSLGKQTDPEAMDKIIRNQISRTNIAYEMMDRPN